MATFKRTTRKPRQSLRRNDFAMPSSLLELLVHNTSAFHVILGVDPIGTFTAVENISYQWQQYEYAELGRNWAPVTRPFEGPGKPGEITLRWGLIVRAKFFDWIREIDTRGEYTKTIYIIHMNTEGLPLRAYQLQEAWPVSWKYSDLGGDGSTQQAIAEITVAYERLAMVNLSLGVVLKKLLTMGLEDVDTGYEALVGAWPDPETDGLVPEEVDDERRGYLPDNSEEDEEEEEESDEDPWAHRRGTWDTKALPEDYVPAPEDWFQFAEPKKYEPWPSTWGRKPLEETYEALPGGWETEALEEDYEADLGEWATEALEEDYEAAVADWYTEALPEEYEAAASEDWGGEA